MVMRKKRAEKKEVRTWHWHFGPALVLAMAIITVSLIFGFLSGAGVLMLASIAASTVILTHKHRHHLTALGTITFAYFIASMVSVALVYLLRIGGTELKMQVFIMVFIITWMLYWLNLFHPPAISFAMAFIVFERGIASYIAALFAALVLFLIVRLIIYIGYEHLSVREFAREFVREEVRIAKEEERRVRKRIKRI